VHWLRAASGAAMRCVVVVALMSSCPPAMTWGMQAIGYIGTGDLDLAYSNFNRSFANVQEPFLVVRAWLT